MRQTYEEWGVELMSLISKFRRSELKIAQMAKGLLTLTLRPGGHIHLMRYYFEIVKIISNRINRKGLVVLMKLLLPGSANFKQAGLTKKEMYRKKELTSILIESLLSKNEEWRGFIGEQKYEWRKAGLTKNKIDRKIVKFFLDLYWGKFKSWIQLPRILSWIRIR